MCSLIYYRPIRPCPPFHLHANACYVGRPFPLSEAREHWRRLRSWGLTFSTLPQTLQYQKLESTKLMLYSENHSHLGSSRACRTVSILRQPKPRITLTGHRGKYDQEYLDYLRELLTTMHEEGIAAYVVRLLSLLFYWSERVRPPRVRADFQVIHQDVFSRYCGGVSFPFPACQQVKDSRLIY